MAAAPVCDWNQSAAAAAAAALTLQERQTCMTCTSL